MLLLLLATLAAPQQAATDPPAAEEIVVVGTRDACKVRYADKTMSDAEFDARARQWASGVPLRVRLAYDADFACMKKIAFKLADKGVRRIDFVDPQGRPAKPFQSRLSQSGATQPTMPTTAPSATANNSADIAAREQRYFRGKAADLIQAGKCTEARKLLLDNADLEAAAQAVTICAAR